MKIRTNPGIMLAALLAMLVFMGNAGLASALGVTPGRMTIDFEPGLEKRMSVTITNNEHKQFNAYVYVEGDLSEYITFDQDVISFNESDNSKALRYRVKLPERL